MADYEVEFQAFLAENLPILKRSEGNKSACRYLCNHAGTDLFSSYCGKHRYYSVHGNICTYMS